MALYATLEGVAARRPGGIPAVDQGRATALLEDACAVVDDCTGLTWTGPSDPLLPPYVRIMVTRLVLRALDNPGGFASEQVGSYSYRRPSGEAVDAGVFLTRAEERRLRRACGLTGTGSPRTPLGYDSTDVAAVMGYGDGS